MEIICPECQFARQVDESKIPARSQVATCPKCKTKFQFRELPEEEFVLESEDVSTPAAPEPIEPAAAQPEEQTAAPADPTPVTPEPKADDNDAGFPEMLAPGEKRSDRIWDKLDQMTPPEPTQPVAPPRREEVQETPQEPSAPIPGWNGEFSDDFPDPMQEELNKDDENKGESPLIPPPFEQLDRYGFFQGLLQTVKLVLLSPRLFYSVMPVGGGLAKPLTFTILITMIQGLAQYIWSLVGLSSFMPSDADTAALGGMAGPTIAVLMLLFLPAFIAASQFVITGIYHLLLILIKADNGGFEGTFRALAYANAPLLLGIFPMPFQTVETAWAIGVAVWGLVLTLIGLKNIHKTSYAKVIPVAIIPLLLGMIAGLLLLQGSIPTV